MNSVESRERRDAFERFCRKHSAAAATEVDVGREYLVVKLCVHGRGVFVLLVRPDRRIAIDADQAGLVERVRPGARCIVHVGLHLGLAARHT